MPSFGVSRTRWPVVAWIRLRVPPRPTPVLLLGGTPPVVPPLDALEPNPVSTDPRKRVYALEEPLGEDAVLRISWDADDPDVLEAELRAPMYGRRPTPEAVRAFWAAVKARTGELGSLAVDGADPRP